MIFQGDLSKYHPADALMFLSQLSLNGVLSVARGRKMLTLTFNDGHLLEAHSAAADDKLVQLLRFHKALTREQEAQIRQVASETGMSIRQVLGELNLFPMPNIKSLLEIGISEVLLELFLLEEGSFHFTDTPVEADSAGIKLDTGAAALTILSHSDEFRDFEKSLITLDRRVHLKLPADQIAALPLEERVVAHMASQAVTVRQLIAKAPFYSHKTMQAIETHLAAQAFELEAVSDTPPVAAGTSPSAIDPLFGAYKQAFKTLIRTTEVVKKVEALIGFCKNFYDDILILTARGRRIVHCKSISIEKGRNIRQKSLKGDFGTIDADPVFQAVHRTGIGFFGKTFSSQPVERVLGKTAGGECALLPILNQPQLSMFVYVATQTVHNGLSPHHYLELLSWLVTPADKTAPAAAGAPAAQTVPEPATAPDSGISALVSRIEELPPLPSLASKTLQLLSDPETSMEMVEKTIAHDQALVAKIIKVSNSALYGGLQKVGSLRQALTRLGAKTTKSLILAASTRSYFFKDRKGMNVWGPLLWQHSIECGFAARRVAEYCKLADPDMAFIGGIMHDVGKLAILMLEDKKFQEIQRIKVTDKKSECQAEMQVIGTRHTHLGCLLMKSWHMPEAVQACTEFHHQPGAAGPHVEMSTIVAYANCLSHTLGNHPQPEALEGEPPLDELLKTLRLTADQNARLLETVRTDFQNTDLMG